MLRSVTHYWRPSDKPRQVADIVIRLHQHNLGPLSEGQVENVEYQLGPNDPTPGIWSSYDESPNDHDVRKEDSRSWPKDTHRSRSSESSGRRKRSSLMPSSTVAEVARELGISEATYHRWKNRYGGMSTSEARRLKELEKENARLKKLLAEKELDIDILKEVSRENF